MLASMRRPSLPGKRLIGVLLMLAAAASPARELALQVERVRGDVASVDGVAVTLAWPAGAAEGELRLRADSLAVPSLSEHFERVEWRCPLSRGEDGSWRCDGPVRSARGGAALRVALSSAEVEAVLSSENRRLAYDWRAGAPDLHAVDLQRVPVAWLEAFLASLWEAGQWTGGTLDGRVTVDTASGPRIAADLALAGVGLETADGQLAAAGMQGRLKVRHEAGATPSQTRIDYRAQGGEFLFGAMYVPLPDSPVDVCLDLRPTDAGGWRISDAHWRDGEVLQAGGAATLAADGSFSDLALDVSLKDLATASARYLSGFLAPAGFGDLVLTGGAAARLRLAGGEWRSLSLTADRVNAIDPRQRFALAGLHGQVNWAPGAQAAPGQLAWDSAALFGIGLGNARLAFTGRDGQLVLREPVAIDALNGQVRLEHLRWQPPRDGQGTRFELGAGLRRLDLGSLSQRLGWPPFTGRISGDIPAARYQDNRLTLEGGLRMDVFEGSVALSRLEMERPFGVAPSLSADVRIQDIDMEPMTAAFGFGSITGRLDGRIENLRMVDWSPVAFDAWLGSDPEWKGRRRISQRAVEDISKVGGGGGLMGGLQAQALRLFDDFRYARLGLGCRLRDNVCLMEGVDSAGDGYTIVEGAGLPRITVVGFRRRVDWPTLVARLKAATEGQVPVIE